MISRDSCKSVFPIGQRRERFFVSELKRRCHCFGVLGEAVPSRSIWSTKRHCLPEDGQAVARSNHRTPVFSMKNRSRRCLCGKRIRYHRIVAIKGNPGQPSPSQANCVPIDGFNNTIIRRSVSEKSCRNWPWRMKLCGDFT